jgi:hypothetical protein
VVNSKIKNGKQVTTLFELERLSENKVHLMEYSKSYLENWKKCQTDFLKFSEVPKFIKDILIYKNLKRPDLFFGEAFVAMRLANTSTVGWFNSWDWISSDDWSRGIYKSDDPIIQTLMDNFYNNAVCRYLAEKLPVMLKLQQNLSIKSEPPDLWLIDKGNKHHHIEVKRGNDRISDEQLLGLLIIHAILGADIHLVWLYEEGARPPSPRKISNITRRLNTLKKLIDLPST